MIEIIKGPKISNPVNGITKVQDLEADTKRHISDVSAGMNFMAEKISDRGIYHDRTKLTNINDFCGALNSGNIKESKWYKMHITEERHHLKSYVPDDVTLIDVIEHLVDCTMAGLARSGEIYDTDISASVLLKACQNTVEMLKANVSVVEQPADDFFDTTINVESE